jgi:hypothetical protein
MLSGSNGAAGDLVITGRRTSARQDSSTSLSEIELMQ